MNVNLEKYGFNEHFQQKASLYNDLFIGRVTEQHRDLYKIMTEAGEIHGTVTGKLAYGAEDQTSFPAVGDWVMIDRIESNKGNAVIHDILKRSSLVVRQAAGTDQSVQVIAANVDTIFICMSLNKDFNIRRIERYLTIAWDSMAVPIIVLTKSDLCNDLEDKLLEIESVSVGTKVIVCSSKNGEGYEEINFCIDAGKTVAFIGSSGVGKSTIINHLMGEELLATSGIREDDSKGRHTTTHRELLLLPSGGIVIDTPGMRELQIYLGDLTKTFEDIEELALKCKFSDCNHETEPKCAVRAAIENGELSEERFESYKKLQREMSYDGLNTRALENEKLNRMFGGKNEMKQMKKYIKEKNRR